MFCIYVPGLQSEQEPESVEISSLEVFTGFTCIEEFVFSSTVIWMKNWATAQVF